MNTKINLLILALWTLLQAQTSFSSNEKFELLSKHVTESARLMRTLAGSGQSSRNIIHNANIIIDSIIHTVEAIEQPHQSSNDLTEDHKALKIIMKEKGRYVTDPDLIVEVVSAYAITLRIIDDKQKEIASGKNNTPKTFRR